MTLQQLYSILALRVYAGTDDLKNGIFNRPIVPADWLEIESHPDNAKGFSWGAYQSGNDIVIAYAGTNSEIDWLGNITIGVGLSSPQVTEAALAYMQIRAANPSANISFTGHSLGGGLASIMAVWFDKPAIVFDEAPFEETARNPFVIGATQVALAAANFNTEAFGGFTGLQDFSVRENNVSNYYLDGEALAYLRTSLPTIVGTVDAPILSNSVDLQDPSGAVKLHNQALLSLLLLNDGLRTATYTSTRILPQLMSDALYFTSTTGTEQNGLIKLLRQQQENPTNALVEHLAADFEKFRGAITGWTATVQDAVIAQTIEWYYWQGTDYAGQEFLNVSNGVFQYTPLASSQISQEGGSRALQYTALWFSEIESTPYNAVTAARAFLEDVNFEQWNVTGVTTAAGASAQDTSKTQLFVGNTGADNFTGGDFNDYLFGAAGADTLNGGKGDDRLYGGSGIDTYAFSGEFGLDQIVDADGAGLIRLNGVTLTGARSAGKPDTWAQRLSDGSVVQYRVYRDTSSTTGYKLVITKDQAPGAITVNNFNRTAALGTGYLGIHLDNTQRLAVLEGTGTNPFFDMADENGNVSSVTQAQIKEQSGRMFTLYLATPAAAGDVVTIALAGPGQWKLQADHGPTAIGGGAVTVALDAGQTVVSLLLTELEDIQANTQVSLNVTYSAAAAGAAVAPLQITVAAEASVGAEQTYSGTEGDDNFSQIVSLDPNFDPDFQHRFYGGAGNDAVGSSWGMWSDDFLDGGDGDDYLGGGIGSDVMFGGAGNDRLFGSGLIKPLNANVEQFDLAHMAGFEVESASYAPSGDYNWVTYRRPGTIWDPTDLQDWPLQDPLSDGTYWGVDEKYNGTPESAMSSDYLDGGDGDDLLSSGRGNDNLIGGIGSDSLLGGGGDDLLLGGEGNDGLSGDATYYEGYWWLGTLASAKWALGGNDYLDGGNGDDLLRGESYSDQLFGGSGDDRLFGDSVYDEIAKELHGDDYLDGETGNDVLVGGFGEDLLFGGAGNDELMGDLYLTVFQDGEEGDDDQLEGGDGNDSLYGSGGNDYLLGDVGDDYLSGGFGNDWLDGGAGSNSVYGKEGNDYLASEKGSDFLAGGDGDDLYFVQAGDAGAGAREVIIADDGGIDTLIVSGANAQNMVVRFAGAQDTDLIIQTNGTTVYIVDGMLNGIENFDLEFEEPSNVQARTLAAASASEPTRIAMEDFLATSLMQQVNLSQPGNLAADQNKQLLGGAMNDMLVISSYGARVNGGRGNDNITVNGGDSIVSYKSGDGLDTVTGDGQGTRVVLGDGFIAAQTRLVYSDTQGMELVFSADSTERMRLSSLYAGELSGSMLLKSVEFSNGEQLTYQQLLDRGVTVEQAVDNSLVYGTNVSDSITTGALDDTVWAGAGNDVIDAGVGTNTIYGDAGDDVYVVSGIGATYLIDDVQGQNTVFLKNVDTLNAALIERVNLSSLRVTLANSTVIELSNAMTRANDYQLVLSNGNRYDIAALVAGMSGFETVGSFESDVIQGGNGADTLLGSSGNDVLRGAAGNDFLLGGEGDDTYAIGAGDGNEKVIDGYGANRISFGAGLNRSSLTTIRDVQTGNLTLSFGTSVSVLIVSGMNGAVGQVIFGNGETLSIQDLLASDAVAGNAIEGDDSSAPLYGTVLNDTLIDDLGDDTLYGQAGDDSLSSGEGGDMLTGGQGNDLLNGGLGEDTYRFALGDGQDKISDRYGLSTISFGAGILKSDMLVTRVVEDGVTWLRLQYSLQDAVLIEDNTARPFTLRFDGGAIVTKEEFLLNFLPEDSLVVEGTQASENLFGRSGDDILLGLTGDDTLTAGDGADVLNGGSGSDLLIGGEGADTYFLATGGGYDVIQETITGQSILHTEAATAAALGFTRIGQALRVTDPGLSASVLISGFFAYPEAAWTLVLAGGQELNLRGAFSAAQVGALTPNDVTQLQRDQVLLNLKDLYSASIANFDGQQVTNPGEVSSSIVQQRLTINSNASEIVLDSIDTVDIERSSRNVTITRTATREEPIFSDVLVSVAPPQELGRFGSDSAVQSVPLDVNTYTQNNADGSISVMRAARQTSRRVQVGNQTLTSIETQTVTVQDRALNATQRVDELLAGDANNTILLSGGSKVIDAGAGHDTVRRAGSGSLNSMYGETGQFNQFASGTYFVPGEPFADFVAGGAGDDRIELAQGDDQLLGGAGNDFLSGGSGSDRYGVTLNGNGRDTVFDAGTDTFSVRVSFQTFVGAENVSLIPGQIIAQMRSFAQTYGLTVTTNAQNRLIEIFGDTVPATASAVSDLQKLQNLWVTKQSDQYGSDMMLSTNLPFIPSNYSNGNDTIWFEQGISVQDLSFSWIETTVGQNTYPALTISWGLDNALTVIMPRAEDAQTFGIENFEFANGQNLSREQLLALAPSQPGSSALSLGTLIPSKQTMEDSVFSFQVAQTAFQIAEGVQVAFSATAANGTSLPSWLQFDVQTRTFSGAPGDNDVGQIKVLLVATDTNTGQRVSQQLALEVLNVNDAPTVVESIPTILVARSQNLDWSVHPALFADIDSNDHLTYRIVKIDGSEIEPWMKFSRIEGRLTGTPANGDAGTHQLLLVATDSVGASVSQAFTVVVASQNSAPIVAVPLPDRTIEEVQAFVWSIPSLSFIDQDANDVLTFSASLVSGAALPTWLTFDPVTLSFSGTPPSTASGALNIRIIATDEGGLSVSDEMVLDVLNVIQGTDANNNLTGTLGRDVIYGLGGSDTLTGGLGADRLIGGLGNDTYNVDNELDIVIEADAAGTDKVNAAVSYRLADFVENLVLTGTALSEGTGNELNNIITGNIASNNLFGLDGNDTLNGGGGEDQLSGGMGNDTYFVDSLGDTVIESLEEGTDKVNSSISFALDANIERLTLTGSAEIDGTGNDLANVIVGNLGANRLYGLGGNDNITGGDAADLLMGGDGNDTLNGGAGNDQLYGEIGSDSLTGGLGADFMVGGDGSDTYYVDDLGDTVVEVVGTGSDKVNSSISYVLGAEVERLTLTGIEAITGTGNELANILIGNAGGNVLSGGAGNDQLTGDAGDDQLFGGDGNDTLAGGVGSDLMVGGLGDDHYTVADTTDIVIEVDSEGTDTVVSSVSYALSQGLENLVLSGAGAITGSGNAAANSLIGSGANNTLSGGEGNDILNGAAGADQLIGGLGNDTFIVDNVSDMILEYAGEGTDRVNASVSYVLADNIETLVLTEFGASNGTGNAGANTITGNTAANTLNGLEGADTLSGGLGSDTYIFGRGFGLDKISENDATLLNQDRVNFLDGIAAEQLWMRKIGNSLEISVIGTTDKLTVNNWYLGGAYHIEQLQLANGLTLLDSQVQNLVNAMASLTPPPLGQTSLTAANANVLAPVFAANWQ
jgi:Ca2+-binding RTX toxin-like protein